jgi:DNA-binding CsgD family transcriptional regulator
MHHSTHSGTKNTGTDDSVFQTPHIALFGEKHWSYLQRRYRMTPRELQIARLVCQGFRNGEISGRLKIKHATVKTHLRNIYRRVRIKSKIEMVLRFVEDTSKFSNTPPLPVLGINKPPEEPPSTSTTAQSHSV